MQITGYTYDAAGNLTKDGLMNTYTYDAESKMTGSNGAVYTFDPLNSRVRKDNGSSSLEYFYFAGQLMATHNPSSGAWNDYIYANGRLIAENPGAQGSGVTFRLGDHLDTLAKTTDGVVNVLGSNDYTPFGQVIEGTAQSLIQFTNHEADTENGTDHTLYRQFSPAQSRWTRPDPSNGSYNLYDPQSFNRYAYLSDRPNNATDPLGLDDGGCGVLCTVGVDTGLAALFGELEGLFGGGSSHLPGEQTNPTPADSSAGDSSMPGDEVGQPDWDKPVLNEQLGLPPSIAAQLGSGGLIGAIGVADDKCDFGACSGVVVPFAGGGANPTTQIQSLYENILEHLEKIAADPENPAVQHWRAEIENWTKQILQKGGKRPGSLDKYLQRIIGISGSDLQNLLPSPIITVDPCALDPLATYCGGGVYRGPV